MKDASNFIFKSGDTEGSREALTLKRYRERLEKMRTLFLFEKSAREITTMNISSLERELRDMIGGIDRLRGVPGIKKLLSSPDAVQAKLQRVIICLNLASDLLEMQITPRRREMLYQRYEEIPPLLSETMDLLTPKRKAN